MAMEAGSDDSSSSPPTCLRRQSHSWKDNPAVFRTTRWRHDSIHPLRAAAQARWRIGCAALPRGAQTIAVRQVRADGSCLREYAAPSV
jgi:hypothetical protein